MTTPADVLQAVARACAPDHHPPELRLPTPRWIILTDGVIDRTVVNDPHHLLADGPTLSLQFGRGDTNAVAAWAALMQLPEPTHQRGWYASQSPTEWRAADRDPGWGGCRHIEVSCQLPLEGDPS